MKGIWRILAIGLVVMLLGMGVSHVQLTHHSSIASASSSPSSFGDTNPGVE